MRGWRLKIKIILSFFLCLPPVLESDGLGKEHADDKLRPVPDQLAPQRYESSPGSKHVVHEQDALPPELFGVELQIGGAVSVPVHALVLRPVISDGYRPVPVGNPHVRRELAAECLVPGVVLLPCGCRDGNQHGTVPVLLNRPDATGGDGEELDEKVGLLAALETPDGVRSCPRCGSPPR